MSRRIDFLARAERNSSTFDNTFQTLGGALASPTILVKIINNSNTDIDVSLDAGTTEHDFVPADSFVLYDIRANHGREFLFAFREGTQWHIRGAAAGVGNVYLVTLRDLPGNV